MPAWWPSSWTTVRWTSRASSSRVGEVLLERQPEERDLVRQRGPVGAVDRSPRRPRTGRRACRAGRGRFVAQLLGRRLVVDHDGHVLEQPLRCRRQAVERRARPDPRTADAAARRARRRQRRRAAVRVGGEPGVPRRLIATFLCYRAWPVSHRARVPRRHDRHRRPASTTSTGAAPTAAPRPAAAAAADPRAGVAPPGPGRPLRAGCAPPRTCWRSTCAATACPTRRAPATTSSRSPSTR